MKALRRIRLFRSLGNACQAGVPLSRALRTFSNRESDSCLARLAEEVESGSSLADAMRKRPGVFPLWQTEAVAVGETSGRLEKVCASIAETLEERRKFWLGVLPKLAYPLFLVHFAPFALRVRTAFTSGMTPYLAEVALTLVPIYAGIALLLYLPRLLARMPNLLRWTPIYCSIVGQDFARFLSMLVASGLGFPRAVSLAARAAGLAEEDPGLQESLLRAEKGMSACETLQPLRLFTDEEMDCLEAGEASGKLERELEHLAFMTGERNRAALETALQMLPTVIFVLVGLYIGWSIIHFYSGIISSRVDMKNIY
ncbi:MAG: type II secretion system F family protein [Elusimicrobiota bacterium]